jgi:hypothetical protein
MYNSGRRVFIFIVLLAITSLVRSQKIIKSEMNGYTDERTIETDIVSLKSGFSTGFGVQYRAQEKFYYINFVGYGRGRTAITEDDRVHLLLKNGSVIKLVGRVMLPANESSIPNIFIHYYHIQKADLEWLAKYPVSIVRVVSGREQADYALGRKKEKAFMKLSALFYKEIGK